MWGRRERKQSRSNRRQTPYESVRDSVKKQSNSLVADKPNQLLSLKNELLALKSSYEQSPNDRDNIRHRLHMEAQVLATQAEITRIEEDRHLEEFVERVHPIVESTVGDHIVKQQKHALFVNLFHSSSSAPTFLPHQLCFRCQSALTVSAVECKDICVVCGLARDFLYCSADYLDEEFTKSIDYERAPLYKKYLLQFHEQAANPPYPVMSLLYQELSKVHMMIKSKIKPTPIAQILRNYGFHAWSHMAQRVCKLLNAEVLPSLSEELIHRLLARFDKVSQTFTLVVKESRKKILNFEYLTHQFLTMENRPDLANCFSLHRTREVLRNADKTLSLCCAVILRSNTTENWNMTKSC